MKKFIALSVAAVICVTAFMTPLTAFADKEEKADKADTVSSKEEKKQDSGKCTVHIRAVMPQEWLDDDNYEFEMTFLNIKEEKSVFLTTDNKFNTDIELKKDDAYQILFSEDVKGYEIGGIDDELFIPDKKEQNVVLTFRKLQPITENIGGDGVITPEQAEQLLEARDVIQKFITNTDKIGLDENDPSQLFKFGGLKNFIKDKFCEGSGTYYNREVYDTLTDTDAFYCYWLSYRPFAVIDPSDPEFDEDKIDYELSIFHDIGSKGEEVEGFNTLIREEIKTVWMWLWDKYEETGSMPDLFPVYMDMKNNVEYRIEDGGMTEPSEVTADEDIVPVDNTILFTVDKEDPETLEKMDFSDKNQPRDNTAKKAKKRFGTILKNNMGTLIMLVITGTGVLIMRTYKKKAKEEDDED